MILPQEATPLLLALARAFTQPTGQRFVLLLTAALLTTGRRTVAHLLRTLGALASGHRTSYQRAHLGRETTRGWCRQTVLRAAPCLFGLYTVVALLYASLPQSKQTGAIAWPGKRGVTFSDALTAVRRWLWAEGVVTQVGGSTAVEKLPETLREIIFTALAPAA